MELAKPCIDVGIFTNQREAQLAFWQKSVGLPFEELLKTGSGSHQLRHSLNGSVFKLNHLRDPIQESPPSGFQELLIARESISSPSQLLDADGNRVSLVPPGFEGISQIGLRMNVSSLEAFTRFYTEILQIEQVSDTSFRWGTTMFLLTEVPDKLPVTEMRGFGYRYITVQVWKVDEEHAAFLARGGTEGMPPRTLGTTARISFIRDPDGNWIEVSQRASLTGDLTPA